MHHLIDCDEPFASSVATSTYDHSVIASICGFVNVPTAMQKALPAAFFKVLQEVASSPLDMQRMRAIVHNRRMGELAALEEQPHDSVGNLAIGHWMYSDGSSKALQAAVSVVQYALLLILVLVLHPRLRCAQDLRPAREERQCLLAVSSSVAAEAARRHHIWAALEGFRR